MKRVIFLLSVFIFLAGAVSSQKKVQDANSDLTAYGLKDTLLKDWKQDINGCNGLRAKYLDEVTGNIKLIGLSDEMILKLFGKPEGKTKCCYGYHISPRCDSKKHPKSGGDYCTVIFYFNDTRLLESIDVNCG
jgi:hypothetical protein